MKLLKRNEKNKKEWVIVSALEKLAKINNICINLSDEAEKVDSGLKIEICFYLDEEVGENYEDFHCDDHISYFITFNNNFNENYKVSLNYVYQMDSIEKIVPDEIKSINELSKVFNLIKEQYKLIKIKGE